VLVSISEDCTVKLWNVKNIEQRYQDAEGNLEPYITLRGHTGPLFAITGPGQSSASQAGGRIVYTAGSEGSIRAWHLPQTHEVNEYGDTYDGRNYCIAEWTETSGEPIWDIKHHPYSVIFIIY
jgi:striatin 1/3/4